MHQLVSAALTLLAHSRVAQSMQLAGLQKQFSEVLGRSNHEWFVALDDNRQRAAGAPSPATMLHYS
jgi:hypothetical protein